MAGGLGALVPQWPQGFQVWRDAINDPLRGL